MKALAVYGVPLAKKGFNPFDRSLEQRDPHSYFLMSPGLDPNFSPLRKLPRHISTAFRPGEGRTRPALSRACLPEPRPARGQTKSGHVLTHLNEARSSCRSTSWRARAGCSILMVGEASVPTTMSAKSFRREIYPPEKTVNYTDDDAFRAALEALPPCATNKGTV